MKLRNFLLVVFALSSGIASYAQSNLLNAKTPDQIGKKTAAQLISDNDKPLPYGYVHDRDVLMGKTVWEIIDLDEKINFPLYFPVGDTVNTSKDRRSLFDVLIKNIKNGRITEVYSDSYFNMKKSFKDMQNSFKYVDTLDQGKQIINDNFYDYFPEKAPKRYDKKGKLIPAGPAKVLDPMYINVKTLTSEDVSGYKIKGYWYFDKRQGELKYRLLGICPIAPEARQAGEENADVLDLFWVYFPAVRDILHEAKAFNGKNSAMPITFDHLLNSRRFNAIIYKEENVYGDREIQEYMKDNALNQLLESERVKEKIRNFEHDMWNY